LRSEQTCRVDPSERPPRLAPCRERFRRVNPTRSCSLLLQSQPQPALARIRRRRRSGRCRGPGHHAARAER
jgi:hypothetical protein